MLAHGKDYTTYRQAWFPENFYAKRHFETKYDINDTALGCQGYGTNMSISVAFLFYETKQYEDFFRSRLKARLLSAMDRLLSLALLPHTVDIVQAPIL